MCVSSSIQYFCLIYPCICFTQILHSDRSLKKTIPKHASHGSVQIDRVIILNYAACAGIRKWPKVSFSTHLSCERPCLILLWRQARCIFSLLASYWRSGFSQLSFK